MTASLISKMNRVTSQLFYQNTAKASLTPPTNQPTNKPTHQQTSPPTNQPTPKKDGPHVWNPPLSML